MPRFRYKKTTPEAEYTYIENVRNKAKELNGQTMYKKSQGAYADQNGLHLRTSETTPTNNIINDVENKFNPYFFVVNE